MRDRFLWIGCAVYALLFTALGVLRYAVHRNLVDFGIFAQTTASAFGCFCNTIEGNHWAFHFSPILYVVGALVAVVHSPLVLIAVQAVAGALVAPPIYALVRRRAEVSTARLSALVVWLYPPLAGLVFGDFHENGFAPAAVAWALYCFDAGLLVWAVVAAAIVLAVKEDQAIFAGVAGLLGWWHYRGSSRGRAALLVAAMSLLVLVAFFAVIQPHALPGAHWQPVRFYAWSGADVRGLFPGGIATRLGFIVLIMLPLLFIPFRSRALWLAAAPLAEVLLSRMPTTFTLGTHYAGAWLGYVLVAFACAVRAWEPARIRGLLWWCVALCVLGFVIADPLHPGLNLRPIAKRDVRLDRFLARLPRNVDVATQEEAYTHLALSDPNARLLPERPEARVRACDILIDLAFPMSVRLREYGVTVRALIASGAYRMQRYDDGIVLYRATAPRCSDQASS